MQVTVRLKNPPSEAENWSLSLCDWDITVPIRFVGWNGKERLDITEAATFEIPSGLKFPLRILALQITKWKVPGEVLQQLYYVQSFRPYLWDWDKSDWSDEPDPTYKEVFIPEYGSFYYNVATEQFEGIASPIEITAPSSAEEGERVSVSVRVTNTLDYHASFKATIYAVPDRYPDYIIGSIDQVITSGSSVTRSASFTMPDCNTTVFVWVERWAATYWAYVGSASKVVSLEVPEATYHLDVFIPSWAYGGYVDPGSGDYPAYSTVKLTAHPLSGYQFVSWGRDASGTSPTYNLYMNSDKDVEAYFEKVPVEEFAGSIAKKELEYDETRGNIPVY